MIGGKQVRVASVNKPYNQLPTFVGGTPRVILRKCEKVTRLPVLSKRPQLEKGDQRKELRILHEAIEAENLDLIVKVALAAVCRPILRFKGKQGSHLPWLPPACLPIGRRSWQGQARTPSAPPAAWPQIWS